ncbi:MAG: ABC transporter permease [Acidihalobacter sp.]
MNSSTNTAIAPPASARLSAALRRWYAQYHHPMTWTGLGVFAALLLFSWKFLLGTDNLGRDMLARMMAGGQATLQVGLLGSLIAMCAGIVYGMFSAMSPGWLDKILMRLLDAVLAIPTLVLMIFFAAIMPLNTLSLVLLLGLVSWPGLARIVRNEALAYRERDYILAARQFGASSLYVARSHMLRAMLPILIVNATFMVADVILALAGLSFLGLGIQPPRASWGGLLNEGVQQVFLGSWWLIVFPGLAIFAAIVAMNLIGQGLLARLEGR